MPRPNLTEKIARIEERVGQLEIALGEKQTMGVHTKRMLSADEAATFLGIKKEGLRGLTHRKLIPYYKPNGKNIYFDLDELVAWQKKHHFEAIYPEVLEGNKEGN